MRTRRVLLPTKNPHKAGGHVAQTCQGKDGPSQSSALHKGCICWPQSSTRSTRRLRFAKRSGHAPWSTPDQAQAAGWSPKRSRKRRHRQAQQQAGGAGGERESGLKGRSRLMRLARWWETGPAQHDWRRPARRASATAALPGRHDTKEGGRAFLLHYRRTCAGINLLPRWGSPVGMAECCTRRGRPQSKLAAVGAVKVIKKLVCNTRQSATQNSKQSDQEAEKAGTELRTAEARARPPRDNSKWATSHARCGKQSGKR